MNDLQKWEQELVRQIEGDKQALKSLVEELQQRREIIREAEETARKNMDLVNGLSETEQRLLLSIESNEKILESVQDRGSKT